MKKEELKQLSPLLSKAIFFQQMSSGFSGDRTYVVTILNGEKLVLKLTGTHQYNTLKRKANILRMFKKQGILCSEVMDMGVVHEHNLSYSILPFIEGENAREFIHKRTREEQYKIGRRAGLELRSMHEYVAPSSIESWDQRVMAKHERYVHVYQSCGVKFEHDEIVVDFINSHSDAVKNRPNRFQHDDFHLGNLIIRDAKYAGAIDFDHYDWGDPIHDFYKLSLFSTEKSIPFSVGQIDGYFCNQPSKEFWLLFSIYTAMSLFSSIVWTLKFDPHHVDQMVKRVNRILSDHQHFTQLEPGWYTNRDV
ncbi:aminoglycoside phosphotransferase family protein [Bacillus sp. Bos-x628]|uniref:aminoglycoside phosphotransferase family protein n=1 Tax=Bacillus maqinnsis TaxID=3229854 RepID=UPI00338D4AE3